MVYLVWFSGSPTKTLVFVVVVVVVVIANGLFLLNTFYVYQASIEFIASAFSLIFQILFHSIIIHPKKRLHSIRFAKTKTLDAPPQFIHVPIPCWGEKPNHVIPN